MNPQQLSALANILVSNPVATIDLMPDSSQPSGATGDDRRITVNFSNAMLPQNCTIANLKSIQATYGTQVTNFTNSLARATTNESTMASMVSLTSAL